ncbi:MAG: cytochrome [SAR86 cluster bacterium]|uniref:Cytochrome n=1 Tax=SAR86 cluster bacterium TaxID=2030880 RepID=A0A2A5C8I7_9GAMM|nr:cytochrome P450 [Gammaproteobacteria bacterium AH-315-E17]PCJ40132.1 MAG: cytochrome [SAR86 cluster bacterium]
MNITDLNSIPSSDIDYYDDELILNPYPFYKKMRDFAPAVWLSLYDVWFVSRYEDVTAGLQNPEVFCSGKGITLNPDVNAGMSGNMVMQDAPSHTSMRKVFMKPLLPQGLKEVRDQIKASADAHIDKLVKRKHFDAVDDLALFLPMNIVTNLIGIDEEGKENMLGWAAGVFNAFGHPNNARTKSGMLDVKALMNYVQQKVTRDMLVKDGWGDRLFKAADEGKITQEQATFMMFDYMIPSLDTTINATSNAIWLFSENPEQWDLLRKNPSLLPNAINEILRMEAPIRSFVRYLAKDFQIGGITLKEGSRAFLSYASASLDERKFENPEKFDITRKNASEHVGFGMGPHSCPGSNLARLEIRSLLESLLARVERFECGEPVRVPHNTLRGIKSLPVTVH